MELPVADGPYIIKVKYDITPGPDKAISDTIELKVEAVCVAQFVIKAGSLQESTEVAVVPDVDPDRLQFLMIRPMLLGKNPITPADLINKKDGKELSFLNYSVSEKACSTKQHKPITGPHVFAFGQTEWITDMLDQGDPGGLSKLYFWYTKPVAVIGDYPAIEKAKLKAAGKKDQDIDDIIADWVKDRHDLTLQIIAGYTPAKTSKSDENKKAG